MTDKDKIAQDGTLAWFRGGQAGCKAEAPRSPEPKTETPVLGQSDAISEVGLDIPLRPVPPPWALFLGVQRAMTSIPPLSTVSVSASFSAVMTFSGLFRTATAIAGAMFPITATERL
jgi:hypothetical protein